ncbi:MAG: SCP2 sterol-binding domain-containing protein [Gammaproteobacteria bacterium]|nr:SCP2 sterol-binding domain-containing protein [Gammaproteobacteria bacterium]
MKIICGGMWVALIVAASNTWAAPVFMSEEWAAEACNAWNENPKLVTGLAGKWIGNDAGRGYKVIHIYRSDCDTTRRVELTITDSEGGAHCSYGGTVQHNALNGDVDYLMYANDQDWVCMGKGDWGCGPMGAMATGKLKFEGPKMEAMSVMGPFEDFLLLTGSLDSDRNSCP